VPRLTHAAFQALRAERLAERPRLLDLAETNLYAALRRLAAPGAPGEAPHIHRCHLANAWLARFGFDPALGERAMVTGGVRDALATLFAWARCQGAQVWLPDDNYPVYRVLAEAADLTPLTFPTIPAPAFPAAPPAGRPEYLLLTHPMKPLGRWLTETEVDGLLAWSRADAARRIVVDAVYTFEPRFHPATLRLFEDGRTILLHSLTKGWLEPRLFGVALLPPGDHDLREGFRAAAPAQPQLARASVLLAEHADLPVEIGQALQAARGRLAGRLGPALDSGLVAAAPGYLTTCALPWTELLEAHGILGIPAEVFGSSSAGHTVLSSLSLA
jgi:hypothetical protein